MRRFKIHQEEGFQWRIESQRMYRKSLGGSETFTWIECREVSEEEAPDMPDDAEWALTGDPWPTSHPPYGEAISACLEKLFGEVPS